MRLTLPAPSCVALPQHRWQQGIGRFEFAVVAIIFAIVAGVLLQKMHFYQQEAEKLAVDRVVMNLRALLADRAASLYLRGNADDYAALANENPISWLKHPPPNYVGAFDTPPAADLIPEGSWYFVRSTSTLTYLLNNPENFGENRAKRLNFKVRFARNSSILTNSHGEHGLGGVTLERTNK